MKPDRVFPPTQRYDGSSPGTAPRLLARWMRSGGCRFARGLALCLSIAFGPTLASNAHAAEPSSSAKPIPRQRSRMGVAVDVFGTGGWLFGSAPSQGSYQTDGRSLNLSDVAADTFAGGVGMAVALRWHSRGEGFAMGPALGVQWARSATLAAIPAHSAGVVVDGRTVSVDSPAFEGQLDLRAANAGLDMALFQRIALRLSAGFVSTQFLPQNNQGRFTSELVAQLQLLARGYFLQTPHVAAFAGAQYIGGIYGVPDGKFLNHPGMLNVMLGVQFDLRSASKGSQ